MSNRSRWILIGALLAVSAFLALPLIDVVDAIIIAPIAYLLWAVGIIYSVVPQPVYWVVMVLAVLYVAVSTLYGDLPAITNPNKNRRPIDGSLVTMAKAMRKNQRGVYHKWQTARMLGTVALDMTSLRLGQPVKRLDWKVIPPCSQATKDYLEAGLNKTFADFPTQGWYGPAPVTALDADINEVLNYLETLMENTNE